MLTCYSSVIRITEAAEDFFHLWASFFQHLLVVFWNSEQVEDFINEKKHLGYTTKEEFFRDAARWRFKSLSDEYEYVEVPKDVYEKLEHAMKEMELPFLGVSDFIDEQIKSALEKYGEWKEKTEENEKRT